MKTSILTLLLAGMFGACVFSSCPTHALDMYPTAETTWGKDLNPGGDLPTNKFKGFYLNTNEPTKVIATEIADVAGINYSWSDFHGINSQDFGAYWAGNFEFNEDQDQLIVFRQSWAKSRIVIDDKIVYDGGDNKSVYYKFTKGLHKIEIEFTNNWHTTNVFFAFKKMDKIYEGDELTKELDNTLSSGAVAYYAGVYESSNIHNFITVRIEPSEDPIVLVLGNGGVHWIVENTSKANIEAIVYPSGAALYQNDSNPAKTYQVKNIQGSYDKNSVARVDEEMKKLIGQSLSGFSGQYAAEFLQVPQIKLETGTKRRRGIFDTITSYFK